MHAKSHGTVVGSPIDSSHLHRYGEIPPSSYAAPYAYGLVHSSAHHADYQPYYVEVDGPRCTCGDRRCAQYSVHDLYDVANRKHPAVTAPYCGHHVGLPPATTAVYPGHQMVYPGEHFQIIRPPLATRYHHHRHGYPPPPPPSIAGAHFVPDGLRATARLMTAALAGCGDYVTSTMATSGAPVVNGDSSMTNIDVTALSASDVIRCYNVGSSASAVRGTSTTSITAEHDITPTRDISVPLSSAAAIDNTQLHAYSSGNLFSSSVTSQIIDSVALLQLLTGHMTSKRHW